MNKNAYFTMSRRGFPIGYFKAENRNKACYSAYKLEKKYYPNNEKGVPKFSLAYRCSVLDDEDFDEIKLINFEKDDISNKNYLDMLRRHDLILEKKGESDVFTYKCIKRKMHKNYKPGDIINGLQLIKLLGKNRYGKKQWISKCIKCEREIKPVLLATKSSCNFCYKSGFREGKVYDTYLILEKSRDIKQNKFMVKCLICNNKYELYARSIRHKNSCKFCDGMWSLTREKKRYLDDVFGHLRGNNI